MKEFFFSGYSWTELAECWNITVKPQPMNVKNVTDEELRELFMVPEKIDIKYRVNNTSMTFTTEDEEEVLAEKLRRHIWSNIDLTKAEFKDKQMRTDIENFLKALIKESEGEFGDYIHPVYKGILKIENDYTFAKWITRNLEDLWS